MKKINNEKELNSIIENLVIYIRVSSHEQAKFGYSLAEQEIFCREYAKKQGYNVLKVFIESGESAKTSNRTQLKKAIEYCIKNKKDVDALLVKRFDRFARNLEDQIELIKQFKKYGVRVLSATETNEENATGNLMRNIIGSFAQYENDIKSERVTAGMKQAFLEGKWLWRAPFGYKTVNGNIAPDEKTAPYVRKIFELFETGLYQQTQIISILKKDDICLNSNHICRMLKNHLYCGIMINKKYSNEAVKGNFEPIITEKTFYKVQAILDGKRPHIAPHLRQNPVFPLKQFITCPNCNQPLTGDTPTGRKGKKYNYYRCYNKNCKIHFNIPKRKLEDKFITYLKRIKPNRDLLELFKAVVKDVYKTSIEEYTEVVKVLNKRLTETEEAKSKLIDLYLADKLREVDYEMKSKQLDVKIEDLKAERLITELPKNDFNDCLEYVCNAINRIDKLWTESELDTKQRIQKMIFPKGLTYDLEKFRTAEKSCLFNIIGALSAPTIKMVPPGEFESPSTP